MTLKLRLPSVGDNAAMQTEPPKADLPKRKRRWFQFSLRTLLIAVTLLCVYFGVSRLWHFSMSASDVASMNVTLFQPAKQIEIPSDQIAKVIDVLADARSDWNPAKWEGLGFVKCRMKSGVTIEIDLFYIDGEEMALRTDQKHYYRGVNAKRLLAMIESSAQASKGGR
jgi:hypothetical protein